MGKILLFFYWLWSSAVHSSMNMLIVLANMFAINAYENVRINWRRFHSHYIYGHSAGILSHSWKYSMRICLRTRLSCLPINGLLTPTCHSIRWTTSGHNKYIFDVNLGKMLIDMSPKTKVILLQIVHFLLKMTSLRAISTHASMSLKRLKSSHTKMSNEHIFSIFNVSLVLALETLIYALEHDWHFVYLLFRSW